MNKTRWLFTVDGDTSTSDMRGRGVIGERTECEWYTTPRGADKYARTLVAEYHPHPISAFEQVGDDMVHRFTVDALSYGVGCDVCESIAHDPDDLHPRPEFIFGPLMRAVYVNGPHVVTHCMDLLICEHCAAHPPEGTLLRLHTSRAEIDRELATARANAA